MLSPHRIPMPKLIFLILCQSEVALSATPKARFAPVVKNEVASGLYKPPREGSEKICSTLPSLTDFSLEVSESGGQQVALASARVGDHHVEMRKKSPLVWKADGVTKAINIRPYEFAHESKRCFNFKANTPTGLSEAGKFMRNMYKLLGKEEGTQAALQLAFCKTLSGPVVGIGLRRNEEGLIIGFEHILLLGRRVEIEHAQEGPRSPSLSYEPVRIYHLPSGRYKATPRKTDRVCSTLPLLTSFEMKVWEYDGQQAAKMTATVADRPVGMAQGVRLACYGDSFVRRLNFTQYGFPKKKPENCFRFQDERDVVEKFMRGLYTAMGEPLTRRQDSSIVICKCTSIILVGMILETKRHRTRTGFKNILFLDGPLAIAAHEQIDSVAPATLKGRERERPSAAVGAAKEHESVPRKQLAFGTYTSKKESTAGLCSTFPLLTGFEFEVSEIDGQQVALATAYVGDQRIVMREKSRLVRYSDVHVGESRWGLTEFFTFKADKGWGMSAAGEFVRRLYRAMGKEEPRQAATHLAFYEVRFGLLVLLDSKWSRGEISSFEGVFSLFGPSTSPTSAESSPLLSANSVVGNDVPSGRYKAVRNGTDKVCSSLPLLTDFEVIVREDGGQQVAVVNAKVADEVFLMTRDVRLVWYSERFTRRRELRRYGLPKRTSKRCFHFVEEKGSPVLKFMHDFYYGAMKKEAPKLPHKHLAFCPVSSKILVGIGVQKAATDRRLSGFENTFFIISKVETNTAAEGEVARLSSSSPVASLSNRKRKSSSEPTVAAKKRSTLTEEPSEEMARSPASDISDFFPDWLLDEELGLDTGWASAPDIRTLWEENSQPTEPVHAHRSPELSLGITENTIKDEENLNVQAGPPPTHTVAGDGSPAPGSLFSGEFPEDFLDKWLLFPELFSPVNLEPTEDVQ